MRTVVFWDLYWGSPILGNCHFGAYPRVFNVKGQDLYPKPQTLNIAVLRVTCNAFALGKILPVGLSETTPTQLGVRVSGF